MSPGAGTIACVGVGNVGRAWAIVFARAGFAVNLYDSSEGAVDKALELIAGNAKDLADAGLMDNAQAVIEKLRPVSTLSDAVGDVIHVQESVREDPQIKRQVIEDIVEAAADHSTIASSTSALPGSSFMENANGRERCMVAHPVNPPSLIPLVELCPTPWTSEDTVQRVRELMVAVDQKPVLLKKEVPGFLLNRLQYTLVGEALHLIGEGYCDPEDIDAVLTDGLALRWVLMGPLQVAHLNATEGFGGFVDQLGEMMRTVGREARPDYPWDQELVDRIHDRLARTTPVSDIGAAQLDRDRRIMSLLNWRKQDDGGAP